MDELELLHSIFDGYKHVPRDRFGRRAVKHSRDLERILALPEKPLEIPDLTDELRRPGSTMELLPAQNDALWNAREARGLLGFMLPGAGKSGTALLIPTVTNVRSAVILTRSQLRTQMLARDVPLWANNFDVRLDRIRFVTYEELSDADTADELDKEPPELLILDEAHRIKDLEGSARGRRLLRFRREHPGTLLCVLSGSLVMNSIQDYWAFAEWALGSTCPLPLHYPDLQEWCKALDPLKPKEQWDPGALAELVEWASGDGPEVPLRVAFQRRLRATVGVSVSATIDLDLPLFMHERQVQPTGANQAGMELIRQKLTELRATEERPDGEVMEGGLALNRAGWQMAFGFYLRAAKELVEPSLWDRYHDAKRAWGKAVNQQLKRASVEGMDSPMLLANAADRQLCISFGCKRYQKETKASPSCSACGGPLQAQWPCPEWWAWKAVKDLVEVVTYPVWFASPLVEDAVLWGRQYTGIIWYRSPALGEAIADVGGFPLFGPGRKASDAIREENARQVKRTIVASIFCHGEGKDLQSWQNNLITDPPMNVKEWEQVLARTHRRGQKAERVDFWTYRHTKELCAAFDTSLLQSKFVEEGHGIEQRLLRAKKSFDAGAYADRALLEEIVRAGDSLTES